MTPSTISDFDVDAAFAEIVAAEWPKLEGRQTPNDLCFTPGDTALGAKAAELARRAGRIRAMPWQSWSLDHIMAKASDGSWTHSECCLLVPRQNGKSLILTIRVLYGLFKLGEKIIFSAQQWETAKSLWKRTWAVVKDTPWLRKHVESHTCSQGRGTIVLHSGAEVVFTTRSAHAGRGLDRVDLIIYDEAYDLTEADMAALSPTKMAAEDPQTIYTSSAVDQESQPNGAVLASVRERGLAGEEGLFFGEWAAPADMDRGDVATWRWANPSFGVIQTVKKLMADFTSWKTPAAQKKFDCEYLGRGDWPSDLAEHVPVMDLQTWGALAMSDPSLVGPAGIALDREPSGDLWAVTAAQRTSVGKIHIEVGLCRSATLDEVAAFVKRLTESWTVAAVVLDSKSQAKAILPTLADAGVEVKTASTPNMAAASSGLLDDAFAGKLSHSAQPDLTAAIEAAVRRELPQGDFVFDRSAVTIPLTSAAMARWALLTFSSSVPEPVAPTVARTVRGGRRQRVAAMSF